MEEDRLQYPGHLWGKLASASCFLTHSVQEFIWQPKYSLMRTEPAWAQKAAYRCGLQASPGLPAATEDVHTPTDNRVGWCLSHQCSLTPGKDCS